MAITDGIIGAWKCNETSGTILYGENSCGNFALTGSIVTVGVPGIIDKAVFFNGGRGAMSGISLSLHNIGLGEERTWSYWVNMTATDQGVVVGKINTTATSNWQIEQTIQNSYQQIRFTARDSTTQKQSTWTSTWPADGLWHLVVVTFTRATTGVNVYVESAASPYGYGGMQLATNTSGGAQIDTSALGVITNAFNLTMGALPGSNPLTGSLDQIVMWNRIISMDEINQIHNSGIGVDFLTGGPHLDSITPSSADPTGVVSITNLAGTSMNFASPTISFKKTGQTDIVASNIVRY